MKILVAEDERDMNALIVKKLTMEGYAVDTCFDGNDALEYILGSEYDAIIMDIMMPGQYGLSVVRQARARGIATPVLFLTARDAIDHRVEGLDAGADDYLIKPFSFKELMARIRAMLRSKAGGLSNTYEAADLVLDAERHTVTRGGEAITLSAREYAILEYLLLNKDIVLSREKIEQHVWNFDDSVSSNAVDVHISNLRKKVDDGHGQKLIHTVRGSGWVLRERA